MSRFNHPVLTIGHSNHPLERFLAMLAEHQVSALADVRSSPYSRFNPQFNREPLTQSLKVVGIRYVYLGRELGGRTEDPSCYEQGRIQYKRLARTDHFRQGLSRVIEGANTHRISLMCAEKEPLECHRTLLVACALVEAGQTVEHILADGSREPHSSTMERLLDLVGVPRRDLFRSREELISEAVERQAERIAYVDERMAGAELREAI